jgi:hypothetical protein
VARGVALLQEVCGQRLDPIGQTAHGETVLTASPFSAPPKPMAKLIPFASKPGKRRSTRTIRRAWRIVELSAGLAIALEFLSEDQIDEWRRRLRVFRRGCVCGKDSSGGRTAGKSPDDA